VEEGFEGIESFEYAPLSLKKVAPAGSPPGPASSSAGQKAAEEKPTLAFPGTLEDEEGEEVVCTPEAERAAIQAAYCTEEEAAKLWGAPSLGLPPAPPAAPEEPGEEVVPPPPRRARDRRETTRGGPRKSPTAYFIEATGRAWCPAGDFERRLQKTVAGSCLVALEARLGLLLRCVEAEVLTHREARTAAEALKEREGVGA